MKRNKHIVYSQKLLSLQHNRAQTKKQVITSLTLNKNFQIKIIFKILKLNRSKF